MNLFCFTGGSVFRVVPAPHFQNRIMGTFKMNQNILIGQVVKFLNSLEGGCLVWRHENGGRADEKAIVDGCSRLLSALAHVNYDHDKVRELVSAIVRKSFRPIPNTLKGVPDVIGYRLDTGQMVVVECKVGADELRPEQDHFLKSARFSGVSTWLCRDIESFKEGWLRSRRPLVGSSANVF